MNKSQRIGIASAFLLLSMLTSFKAAADDELSRRIQDIQTNILTNYDNVQHISAEEFSRINQDTVVIFDVREQTEYEVSHIAGAIQIDPKLSPEEFFQEYGETIKDKTAFFYCSVGRRSSALLSQINEHSSTKDSIETYNLTGGLFHWHNTAKPLVDLEDTTSAIHPYNFYWGRLLENRSEISYRPK